MFDLSDWSDSLVDSDDGGRVDRPSVEGGRSVTRELENGERVVEKGGFDKDMMEAFVSSVISKAIPQNNRAMTDTLDTCKEIMLKLFDDKTDGS